jgi:hypothetical protein
VDLNSEVFVEEINFSLIDDPSDLVIAASWIARPDIISTLTTETTS